MCVTWKVCRKVDTIPWSLSGLILYLGILSVYSEGGRTYRRGLCWRRRACEVGC